jgi:hypothetical protein
LLYVFLTSEEDSNGIFELVEVEEGSSFLPDLNPIRAMRNAKERGQNLKPFILNLLAKVLSPPARPSSLQQFQYPSYESRESLFSKKYGLGVDDSGDDRRLFLKANSPYTIYPPPNF